MFEGAELAEVVDRLSGRTDVRSSDGFMGLITLGTLPRVRILRGMMGMEMEMEIELGDRNWDGDGRYY